MTNVIQNMKKEDALRHAIKLTGEVQLEAYQRGYLCGIGLPLLDDNGSRLESDLHPLGVFKDFGLGETWSDALEAVAKREALRRRQSEFEGKIRADVSNLLQEVGASPDCVFPRFTETTIHDLRALVRWADNQRESILQGLHSGELLRLWRADHACKWAISLDRWSPAQIEAAAKDGIVPRFDE